MTFFLGTWNFMFKLSFFVLSLLCILSFSIAHLYNEGIQRSQHSDSVITVGYGNLDNSSASTKEVYMSDNDSLSNKEFLINSNHDTEAPFDPAENSLSESDEDFSDSEDDSNFSSDPSSEFLLVLEYNSEQESSSLVLRLLKLFGLNNYTQKIHIDDPSTDDVVPRLESIKDSKTYENMKDIMSFLVHVLDKQSSTLTIYGIKQCVYCDDVLNFIQKNNLQTKVDYISIDTLPLRKAKEIYKMISESNGSVSFPVMFCSLSNYPMFESSHIIEALEALFLNVLPSQEIPRIEGELRGNKGKVLYSKKYSLYVFDGDIMSVKDVEEWLKKLKLDKDVTVCPLSDKRNSKACSAKIKVAESINNTNYDIPVLFTQGVTAPIAHSFYGIKEFFLIDYYKKVYEETNNVEFYNDFTLYLLDSCSPCEFTREVLAKNGFLKRLHVINCNSSESYANASKLGIHVFPTLAVNGVATFQSNEILSFFRKLDSVTEKRFKKRVF